jgi:hypothetical protein
MRCFDNNLDRVQVNKVALMALSRAEDPTRISSECAVREEDRDEGASRLSEKWGDEN